MSTTTAPTTGTMSLHQRSWTPAALLPTNTTIRPSAPQDAEYFDAAQVAYIVERTDGALRCLTSFGGPSESWGIGTVHDIAHDQTGRLLGTFTVVGVRDFGDGTSDGLIPTNKIPHWVFK